MSGGVAGPASDAATVAAAPGRAFVIANVVVFQACWFACVLGAAHGMPWLGAASVVAMAIWHLSSVARPTLEVRLIGGAIGIGVLFDAVLVGSGAVTYPNGWWVPGLGPHWMLALWALFAMTLNVSLRWLKGRLWLAALLGAVSGPLSFWGGVRLGAATLLNPPLAVGLMAVGWALAMPLLMWLAARWDGVTVAATPPAPQPLPMTDGVQRMGT